MKRLPRIKKTKNGLAMLNLGCGSRTHWEWNNIDFSLYALLAHHRQLAKFLNAVSILSDFRYQNLLKVDPDIIHWDIGKGLPFEDNVFDALYNSHFITHLDRDIAVDVTRECYRVLKHGGVVRVVVPDLLQIVCLYNDAIDGLKRGDLEANGKYKEAVDELFELMVRKISVGTGKQNPLVRLIERLVRGDINRTGELRRWHYDQYSMGAMLSNAGFRYVHPVGASESRIQGWNRFGLDLNQDGSIYKPGSLYMEGAK